MGGVCTGVYNVWTENAKDEERICNKDSVSETETIIIIIIIIMLLMV
jgi:hypothetical protein